MEFCWRPSTINEKEPSNRIPTMFQIWVLNIELPPNVLVFEVIFHCGNNVQRIIYLKAINHRLGTLLKLWLNCFRNLCFSPKPDVCLTSGPNLTSNQYVTDVTTCKRVFWKHLTWVTVSFIVWWPRHNWKNEMEHADPELQSSQHKLQYLILIILQADEVSLAEWFLAWL